MLSSHLNRNEAESDFSSSNGYNRVSSGTSVSNDNLDSVYSGCQTDQCQMQSDNNNTKKKSVLLNLKSGRINSVALPEEFVDFSRRFSNSTASVRRRWIICLVTGALVFFILGLLFANLFESKPCDDGKFKVLDVTHTLKHTIRITFSLSDSKSIGRRERKQNGKEIKTKLVFNNGMRVHYVSVERIKKESKKRISRTRVNQLMDTNLFPLFFITFLLLVSIFPFISFYIFFTAQKHRNICVTENCIKTGKF